MFRLSELAILGAGLAVGGYWRLSRGMILTIDLFAGSFATLLELMCDFVASSLTPWWVGGKAAAIGVVAWIRIKIG